MRGMREAATCNHHDHNNDANSVGKLIWQIEVASGGF